jgi:nitroreductase
MVVCAQTANAQGEINRSAEYDAGAAAFSLTLQAHALGLAAHQMGGIDRARLSASFAIPAGFEVMAMIVVGHHGDAQQLEPKLLEREQAERQRVPLGEVAYRGAWGVSM